MLWVEFLFQIVIVTIDGQLQFWWLCGPLSHRKNIRSNSSWLINNLLYQEKRITNEVEKRWPRGSALPIYRNKADAIQVDKYSLGSEQMRELVKATCPHALLLQLVLVAARTEWLLPWCFQLIFEWSSGLV